MIDFESRLAARLDDIAASVPVHTNIDAVFLPKVAPARHMPHGGHRFRPAYAAAAAAGIVLLGGSALAMGQLANDPPQHVISAAAPTIETIGEPTTTTAESPSTTVEEVATTIVQGSAMIPVVVGDLAVAQAEPTLPPVVIEFTAKLGSNGLANNPMQQGFSGTAQPGSAIRVASPYGVSETTANGDGAWEATLTMLEVPPGTKVAVRITSSTTDKVREFTLKRSAPVPPATIEFTANLGTDGLANTPMSQGFYGTAQPGSAIRIGSEWGVAETVAGPNGNWDATLVMPEVPPGTKVAVRITSSTTDKVREFTLKRPGEPAPTVVAFTANAALTVTDHTPPVNEYWGTSTAGAVISITSEYGSTQVESNAEGQWSARLEFPDAPFGVAFNVHITSSKGEAIYDFALTRVGPT
jgi:hypothetical protein